MALSTPKTCTAGRMGDSFDSLYTETSPLAGAGLFNFGWVASHRTLKCTDDLPGIGNGMCQKLIAFRNCTGPMAGLSRRPFT
jgi:hypothetical protein